MAVTQIRGSSQIKDGSITSAKVDSSIIVAAGSNAFGGNQSMGGNKLTNLGTPTTSTDAVTKAYVDAAVNGLDWKASVRCATTTAGTLATDFENGDTIDGVTLVTGDRILLKNQSTGSQNGIYTVNASGAPTRATDADADAEVTSGLAVFVEEGTANGGKQYLLTTANPITVGSTSLTFTLFGGGSTYTGTDGIDVTGTVISPVYGSSANTVCEGNDSRLSDARTPVGTSLTSAQIWVGNGSNLAAAVAVTGDLSLANTGAFTVLNHVRLSKYITRETPSGTVNGSNVTFTLAATPVSGSESVFLNGILQEPGSGNDYTISGDTITYETAPLSGDRLRVSYISQ